MQRAERQPRGWDVRRRDRRNILVVCGGLTEATYIIGVVRARHARRRGPAVTTKVRAQDPTSLVEYAARLSKHRESTYDEVWCIVDVDEFDIDAAVVLAGRHGIELAVSNPCFELWLLLHHEDYNAYLDGYPAAAQRLRRHVPGYDKANLNFGDFEGGVEAAVKRAKALDPERNPSSGMWRLVEKVMEQK